MKPNHVLPVCFCSLVLAFVSGRTTLAEEITALAPDSVVKPFKNRSSHGKLIPAATDWPGRA